MMKARCPICGNGMHGPGPTEWPDWPFCSRRCKTIDLGRWLGESYRIAMPALPGASDPARSDVARSDHSRRDSHGFDSDGFDESA